MNDFYKMTEGITLSGAYRHNDDSLSSKRLDFNPTRFDYTKEGISLMHHDVFVNAEDSQMTNYTRLDLTRKMGMSGMSVDSYIDQADIIIFTMIKVHNGGYLRVVGDRIYAEEKETDEDKIYDSSYMFKIIKKNGYYEIGHDEQLFHVDVETMSIVLGDRQAYDDNDLYKFGINRYGNSGRIMIYTMMNHPWGMDFEHPIDKFGVEIRNSTQEFGKNNAYEFDEIREDGSIHHGIRYNGTKRYWSIYDGPIYASYDGILPNMVKCNGILWKFNRGGQPGPQYPTVPNETYVNASNNYIFLVEKGTGADEKGMLVGYDGKIRWVQYHNEFYNKFFNQTTTPKEMVDEVSPNMLIDVPYETKFDKKSGDVDWLMPTMRQKLDIMQAKNVLTPNGEYALKGGSNE